MPRVREPVRRRRGGGGTMGVRANTYQRRDTEIKPYWPEEPMEGGSEHQQEEGELGTIATAVHKKQSATATLRSTRPNLTQAAGNETKEPPPSYVPTTNRRNSLNKKSKRKKSSLYRHSPESLLGDDEDFTFGTKKSSSALTPKVSSEKNLAKPPPLVTPAISCTSSAVGVRQQQRQQQQPQATNNGDSGANAAMENRFTMAMDIDSSHHSAQEKKATWQSPLPHSPSPQALPSNLPTSSLDLKLQYERKMQAPQESNRVALEEQQQKYEHIIMDWKNKCDQKDNKIAELEETIQCLEKNKYEEDTMALRATFQREENERRHQQRFVALQQEFEECKSQLEKVELERLQDSFDHQLRMNVMSQTFIELSRGHRESQEENQRQRMELESAQHALKASQEQLRNLWTAQEEQILALEERRKDLDRRERILAEREQQAASEKLHALPTTQDQQSPAAIQQQHERAPSQQNQRRIRSAAKKLSTPGSSNSSTTGSPIQPLHLKTVSRNKSPTRRRLRDFIPSYNFLCIDLSEEQDQKSKRQKLAHKPIKSHTV